MSSITLKNVLQGHRLWLLGGFVSLSIHGLIWQQLQHDEAHAKVQMAPAFGSMRISMSVTSVAPPVAAAPLSEPLPANPPVLTPISATSPNTPRIKQSERAKTTHSKEKLKPIPKPVPKPRSKKRETVELTKKLPIESRPNQVHVPAALSVPEPLQRTGPILTQTELKNQLVAELMRRIDRNKHYPKRALKRGIEGRVRFTLVLDREGQLQAFEWLEGNRLFYKSTLAALKRSLPLKQSGEQQPLKHQLALQYQISR